MISYPISVRELCRRIEKILPATRNRGGALRKGGRRSWHTRARLEEHKVIAAGEFPEDALHLWNELKRVFALIQGDQSTRVKCAYCERHLHLGKNNLPDGDIDHFRPKSLYPMLAYHVRNYVLSCRICNETYKQDYFPITRQRATKTKRLNDLYAEQAYLVNPLDPQEPNLEDIIGFDGILGISLAIPGTWQDARANAMIDTFKINNRDDLRREQTEIICEIFLAKTGNPSDLLTQSVLTRAADRFEEHTNCAMSYLKLWDVDVAYAKLLGQEAYDTLYP